MGKAMREAQWVVHYRDGGGQAGMSGGKQNKSLSHKTPGFEYSSRQIIDKPHLMQKDISVLTSTTPFHNLHKKQKAIQPLSTPLPQASSTVPPPSKKQQQSQSHLPPSLHLLHHPHRQISPQHLSYLFSSRLDCARSLHTVKSSE